MTVSPEDFQAHADRVKEQYSDEIDRRAVISRYYYYIFHRMREENDSHPDSNFTYQGYGSDHSEASDFLKRIDCKDLADCYDDLRNKRNEADYDIDKNIGPFEMQMFLADLEDFEEQAEKENVLS